MRGKFLHNQVMIALPISALRSLGYAVAVEYPVRAGRRPPCVDGVAIGNDNCIVLEAECSPARAINDLAKARAIAADVLLIIVPDAGLRSRVCAVLNRLPGHNAPIAPKVLVLTLGAALRWISQNCPPVARQSATNENNRRNQRLPRTTTTDI